MITTKGDLITTGEWLLGVSGDWCLGPTDNSVGVWSRADFTALQRRSDFTINHQLCMSGCGWRPRTDAAKCDTHFYILFQLGNISLEDFSHRVIDTVLYRARLLGFICLFVYAGEDTAWRGSTGPTDRRSRFIILLSALGIYACDESVDVRHPKPTSSCGLVD